MRFLFGGGGWLLARFVVSKFVWDAGILCRVAVEGVRKSFRECGGCRFWLTGEIRKNGLNAAGYKNDRRDIHTVSLGDLKRLGMSH